MDVQAFEDQNGIRVSTFTWPTNQQDAATLSLPIGCTYTPLKKLEHLSQPLPYSPLPCHQCGSVLNPYCNVDYDRHTWICPFCNTINPMPSSYQGMTKEQPVAEILPNFTTAEYSVPNPAFEKPVFIFVIDTCSTEREHNYLKTILLQAIATLPPDALVGFITFGTTVSIKELVYNQCQRDYVFNGNKIYNAQQMQQFLSFYPKAGETTNNFIVPAAEAEQILNTLVDELPRDPFPIQKGERATRCTGAALSIAINLMQAVLPMWGGHILLFTSGPITKGPGAMASMKRMEPIRQHGEIEAGKAPLTPPSQEFFANLGKEANTSNIVINYIGAGFEETGVHEVSPAVLSTGGFLLSCETFNDETIADSLFKLFNKEMLNSSGFDGTIKVMVSPSIKVRGCVGPCLSSHASASYVSDKVIGEGGTNSWHTSGLMPDTTFAMYFDVNAQKTAPRSSGERAFIQFVTKYRSIADGQRRERVTTIPIVFANLTTEKEKIVASLDQQAATVLLAKLCVDKARSMQLNDVVRFLDKTLIDTCRALGYFTKGRVRSLQLPEQINQLAHFVYHFRRSSFMSTFNSTPDQTMSQRMAMLFEDINSCLLMICPMLKSYPVDAMEPSYVPLEMTSLLPKTTLFLDTYFRTLVWYGKDVAAWREQGLHEQAGYENVKKSIELPLAEAKEIHGERFPSPQLITCDQDSSLSRYLLVKCNPTTVEFLLGAGENLGSDEPSYDKFFNKLKAMIVK